MTQNFRRQMSACLSYIADAIKQVTARLNGLTDIVVANRYLRDLRESFRRVERQEERAWRRSLRNAAYFERGLNGMRAVQRRKRQIEAGHRADAAGITHRSSRKARAYARPEGVGAVLRQANGLVL